jgi:outer membrane protein OmpA-like peptidoglycan-associated protein
MRKAGLTLLVGSMVMVPYAAMSQESAAPSPDEFVCALTGECGEAAAEEEAAPDAQQGDRPRVSATRGFSLSRPNEPAPAPKATRPTTRQTAASNRQTRPTTRRPQNRPAQQQTGRADLRLAFASGSAELSAADRLRVQAFAEALKRPQLANVRVRIEGHTDSSGGRSVNLTLSQRRAQAVADFLVSQGIPLERLEVRGYGYDRPLPGRRASSADNRRVEAVRIS